MSVYRNDSASYFILHERAGNNSYDKQNRLIKTEAKSKETGKTTSHTYSYNECVEVSKQDDTAFEYGDVSGQVTKEVITDKFRLFRLHI